MKQKLLERKTYTPKSAPPAPGPVTLCLNSSKAVGTVMQSSKTSNNTPEEALTPTAQGGQDLRVPVIYVPKKLGGVNHSVRVIKSRELGIQVYLREKIKC